MSDIVYRMIDAGHGAVMVLLLLLIGRLLLVRRENLLRVHYVAGLYLQVSCVQMLVLFLLEDDTRISIRAAQPILYTPNPEEQAREKAEQERLDRDRNDPDFQHLVDKVCHRLTGK